jgi:NAD-dependent DNA ligase
MDKIKPDTGALSKWLTKYNKPKEYVFSAKLDGVSGLYANGKLYTRGNGKVGQDVSHLIPYLKLPKEKDVVIRGEFLISKENFENHFQDKANPRNTVSGIINKLSVDKKEVKYLDFVAYELIKPEMKPLEQLEYLKKHNVDVVLFAKSEEPTNELLSSVLVEWRSSYKYEIDGIICTHNKIYPRKSGNPEHAFAFKMVLSDQIAEAKVVDVLWTPSKDGFLKPKIRIEPIELGGVTIEYATAFNAAFIESNNLGIGAVVQMIRSGDVIPYIMDVTQQAPEPKMPDEEYTWNKTHVDIVLKNASSNKIVLQKNIAYFFRDIGVAGLSSGNIKRIMEAGFDSIPKILAMSKDDFLTVEGFKEKLATKIHTNIENAIDKASLVLIMNASNIFGRGLGLKKIQPIMAKYPDILTSEDDDDEKIEQISEIKGMGEITAKEFVSNISEFLTFINEAGLDDKLDESAKIKDVDTSHVLYGKKLVITGFRDSELEKKITSVGAELTTSVSKNTFKVIVKELDEDSGKADKGRKLGILITKEEFESKYF